MILQLLNYQEIDKDLKKIEQEIALNEDRKKALTAKAYAVEGEELAAKIDRRAIELINVFHKLKETYKEYAATISEYETLSETLTDEGEILYFNKKVAQALNNIKNIEKDINVLKAEIESTTKAFNDFKKKFVAAKADYTKYKENFDRFKESKAGEVADAEKKLSELAKTIDKTLIDKYNKKRADKIFPILVPLMGNMCGGCNTELPLNAINKIKSESYIECENCRRMIIKN